MSLQSSIAARFASGRFGWRSRDTDFRELGRAGRVVVAMSSIPSRLALSEIAIRSVLSQSLAPDRIYLSIPYYSVREKCDYTLPENIVALVEAGSITLVRTDSDYGPGTKLLGCVREISDDDVIIVLDDDNFYEPFVVSELSSAIRTGCDAASFHVYESHGIRVGQGADGFAMLGAAAKRCLGAIDIMARHPIVLLQDDYWISFMLRRQGVRIKDLSPSLRHRGLDLCYTPLHSVNGLDNLQGEFARSAVNREVSSVLFREASPTAAMRAARKVGWYKWSRFF